MFRIDPIIAAIIIPGRGSKIHIHVQGIVFQGHYRQLKQIYADLNLVLSVIFEDGKWQIMNRAILEVVKSHSAVMIGIGQFPLQVCSQ